MKGVAKKGDSVAADIESAVQVTASSVFPVVQPASKDVSRKITAAPPALSSYATLRKARSDKKLKGGRDLRAKAKAEEEAQKKK